MLATLFGSLWAKLAGVGVAALSLLGLFFSVRRSGEQAQKNADLQQSIKNVSTANETATDVSRMSDPAVDQQLRGSFSRD